MNITDPNYIKGKFHNSTYEEDFLLPKPNNRFTECESCGKTIRVPEQFCEDCKKPKEEAK